MARRVILETQYTFTPSTRTIVVPRILLRERVLLITNTTTNTVIYNFSDPSTVFTSFTTAQNTVVTNATTTMVLSYNTTSMSSTDDLQITVDEVSESMMPDESLLDPVGKMRVSQPQALIDTDFEYGLQPTKWEALAMINNRPSFFVNTQTPITITGVSATNGSTAIVVSTASPPAVGTPVLVQDTFFAGANGNFVITAISAGVSFTYQARTPFTGSTGSIYDSTLTAAYNGSYYTNVSIPLASQPTAANPITFTTTNPHGFQIGDGIYVTGSTATTNPPNGSWNVAAVPTATTFQVVLPSTPTGVIAGATLYPRPDGFNQHRAFDGGVTFTSGSSAPNNQFVRQTRRYFRYQSGKGIQVSTGTILKPSLQVDEISASGTNITVTCKLAHQLNPGVSVTVSGANESAYNGTFTVATVINAYVFTYTALSTPSATPASGTPAVSVVGWYGASNRLGLFDSQNGVFFEFDGQTLYAVRRASTTQLSGFVNVTNLSNTVTGATVNGVTTKFSKQLTPGDFIVIRGMTYRVMTIASDTSMTITPAYRGPTLSGLNSAIVSKTTDLRVAQSQFNIDKLDGTGPSGLVLDLSKMQMFYIDYSWYGAGSIRMGFRDTQGRVFYCHRFVNNNQNTEAYMRSGNLPARYETHTFAPVTTLAASMTNVDTTMTVSSTSAFPSSGVLFINDPGASGMEYVSYTGKTDTTFTGLVRGKASTTVASCVTTINTATFTTTSSVANIQVGMMVYGTGIPYNTYVYSITTGATNTIVMTQGATASGTVTLSFNQMGSVAGAHTYAATAPMGVYLYSPQFSPTLSHWGTSVIMDGRFDDDKSLVFTYGEVASTSITAGTTTPLLSIRVSPSADSGITGFLGLKEIINRMQLTLKDMAVLTNGSYLVTLVLNGTVAAGGGSLGTFAPVAVGTSSLAQIADHTGACTITGGETIFGYYAVNSAGGSNFSTESADLSRVRDLGNSILGGGINNTPGQGVYPDGPDVVTIVARNIGSATSTIQARINWTEAQA